MLTNLILHSALAVLTPAQSLESGNPAVPGLVEIPAGRVQLGLKESRAKELIEEHPNTAQQIGAQVGNHRPALERFWISPTEVTNEQYLRFVEDTGAMPPASWVQLTREQRLAIIDELKKDNPAARLDANTLGRWWEDNWQSGEYEWKVLPEEATMPVGYISHEDARAFCKWAGLRLPTEEEWVRAARGDEDRDYPMGDFDARLIAHEDTKPRDLAYKPLPAASLENASPYGLYDMTGNHWEWTDSRFEALPKFKPFNVKTEKAGKVDVAPNFDASYYIIKGGSYMNPGYVCTVHTRPGLQGQFRAEMLGFRVASSGVPGRDYAAYELSSISSALVGGMPSAMLSLDRVVGLDKHRVVDAGEVEGRRGEPKKPLPASKLPSNYAVFDRADSIAIVPMAELEQKESIKWDRLAEEEGPVAIGALFSSVALERANALAGNYVLMYMPPMDAELLMELGVILPEDEVPGNWKPKKLKEDEVPMKDIWPTMEGLNVKSKTPYILLVDNDRQTAGLVELPREPRAERIKTANNSISFRLDRGHIDFQVAVPAQGGKKAFMFNIPLVPRTEEGARLTPTDWNPGPFQVVEAKED